MASYATLDVLVNDFAIRSFRDTADHDYIAARLAYRSELVTQFYWSALHSIEKYLKAILLLNRVKSTSMKHDLDKGLRLLGNLPFEVQLSEASRKLIAQLNSDGMNRYLQGSYVIHGPVLVQLDRAVWEIRRYCRVINYNVTTENGATRNLLDLELASIKQSYDRPPHTFRILGGALEKIVDKKNHPAREALLWQNGFFGKRRRKVVSMRMPFLAVNAPLTLHPEILDEVLQYVYLENDWIKAYRQHQQESEA